MIINNVKRLYSNKMNDITIGNDNNERSRRVMQLVDAVNMSVINNDYDSPIWNLIRYEASSIAEGDMKAATIMVNSILQQPSLNDAIIDYVASQLDTPIFQATQIRNLFAELCDSNPLISSTWQLDLMASAMRDDEQPNAISVLLFNKGFHSLVTYRMANALWYSERDGLARYFQSLSSRIFGADIHPASKIGPGCVISGSTGIVIGETAVLGNDCYISHDVTLGGTGKESGDRHPKLGKAVFVGAGATILGNIKVGDGAVINAGSVVTKPVDSYVRVGGVPAKFISKISIDEETILLQTENNYRIAAEVYDDDDLNLKSGLALPVRMIELAKAEDLNKPDFGDSENLIN
jgi:serine O-acetyltransferase